MNMVSARAVLATGVIVALVTGAHACLQVDVYCPLYYALNGVYVETTNEDLVDLACLVWQAAINQNYPQDVWFL